MSGRSIALLCAALLGAASARAELPWSWTPPNPSLEIAEPQGLPALGKWMLTGQGLPSDWLGETYQGKVLREPINIIIIDESAVSREEAIARLLAAAARAGYPVRLGHSAGYQAMIGGQLYAQLPKGWDDAFSNKVFELSNDHGRIFGPHRLEQSYLFTGAFSRERVDLFRWPGHRYASFNQARDDFAQKMDRGAVYRAAGSVQLDNDLPDDPRLTTGDHDGRAIVLRASR